MDEIYSDTFWRLFADQDVSRDTAGPAQLHDLTRAFLPDGASVLDVGCRDATHLVELVRSSNGTGLGIDPVPWHLQRARDRVAESGLGERIEIAPGVAELVPAADAAFDLVWCRDVIEVLPDLAAATSEFVRVLASGGHVAVFTNVLDGPCDEREDRDVHLPLGNVPGNLVEDDLLACFAERGLTPVVRHVVGTDWREHAEERTQLVSRDLLRLARLRGRRDAVVAEYGLPAFRTAEASLQWRTYQFLGRFVPMIYVFEVGLSGTRG